MLEADCVKLTRDCTVKQGTRLIAANAFYGCDKLTSIVIPESVMVIGSYAFSDSTSLQSADIPEG